MCVCVKDRESGREEKSKRERERCDGEKERNGMYKGRECESEGLKIQRDTDWNNNKETDRNCLGT